MKHANPEQRFTRNGERLRPQIPQRLTTAEVADFFRVSQRTIQNWRNEGLPHLKLNPRVIRYSLDELMAWRQRK
jgi:phage terminase Nu1 subunit (DNA packaging protein)